MQYDKPYKTYSQRIDHLIDDYNLVINDRPFAEYALKTISYYDLINGYKDIFMVDEKYDGKTTIEFLYQFFLYDKEFQNMLFTKIILIENFFKNVLANELSSSFGVCETDYLDISHFNSAHPDFSVAGLLRKIRGQYLRADADQPTKYYRDNHNHIPPWILFKNITFSQSINLFVALKSAQKDNVALELIPTTTAPLNIVTLTQRIELLTKGLNLIRSFRNTTAHNLKFVTYRGKNQTILPRAVLKKLLPPTVVPSRINGANYIPNDLYAAILFIYILLGPRLQMGFSAELTAIGKSVDGNTEALRERYREITGLPPNFDHNLELLFDAAAGIVVQ